MIYKIEKLLKKDKILLFKIISDIRLRNKDINVKKINDSDFYHIKKGIFNIIFHYDNLENIIIDSIKVKKKNAYKDI